MRNLIGNKNLQLLRNLTSLQHSISMISKSQTHQLQSTACGSMSSSNHVQLHSNNYYR